LLHLRLTIEDREEAMRAATGIWALVLLAVPAFAQDRTPPPRNTGNRAHELFVDAPPATKKKVMESQIQYVGEKPCSVTRVSFRFFEQQSKLSMWRADCSDGRSYMVNFAADAGGSSKVLSCAVMKSIGNDCFN
jgi:hypothetical protein